MVYYRLKIGLMSWYDRLWVTIQWIPMLSVSISHFRVLCYIVDHGSTEGLMRGCELVLSRISIGFGRFGYIYTMYTLPRGPCECMHIRFTTFQFLSLTSEIYSKSQSWDSINRISQILITCHLVFHNWFIDEIWQAVNGRCHGDDYEPLNRSLYTQL